MTGTGERVRLTVADDGRGVSAESSPSSGPVGGTGLTGLGERLAAAGGSLRSGPGPHGGFLVTAELPVDPAELTEESAAPLPETAA